MVSNLHSASEFMKLQKNKKIGRGLSPTKKLRKDIRGFYLIKKNNSGKKFKQRIKKNDLLYSRTEGVTKYSPLRDKTKTKNVQHIKENRIKHSKTAHKSDRLSLTGNIRYKK